MRTNYYESCKKAFSDPIITDRLVIRPPAPADAQAISVFFNAEDMAFARELGWPADDVEYTLDYTSDVLLPYMEELSKNNDCWLFIFERHSAAVIGKFSFWRDEQNRDHLHYFILPSLRRQGYATEAANACLRHAVKNSVIRTLHAEVLPGNAASINLLRRLGFVEKGPVCSQISRYRGQTLLAFKKDFPAPAQHPPVPAP